MMLRYLRAFIRALQLSLRGKQPPPRHNIAGSYPDLGLWCAETIRLLDELAGAAGSVKVDMDSVIVRADGRDQSMNLILKALRFHAEQEYPYLMAEGDKYRWMTLQATNLNDRFLISRLKEKLPDALLTITGKLTEHLEKLPQEKQ